MSEHINLLFDATYAKLKQLASAKMRNERVGHTLTPTALLSETYLRLQGFSDDLSEHDFIYLCSRVMRNCLIDYSRYKNAKSRSSGFTPSQQTISLVAHSFAERGIDFGSKFDEFLSWLDEQDKTTQAVFNLRTFAGNTTQEVAVLVGESVSNVNRRLSTLEDLLMRYIGD